MPRPSANMQEARRCFNVSGIGANPCGLPGGGTVAPDGRRRTSNARGAAQAGLSVGSLLGRRHRLGEEIDGGLDATSAMSSAERRGGKECGSTCKSRMATTNTKTKKKKRT